MAEISTSSAVNALLDQQLDFAGFATRCAGAFIPLQDGKLPESLPLPTADSLDQKRGRLEMLRALDDAEQVRERAIQGIARRLTQAKQEQKQALAMQKTALEWEPPSDDHQPLKKLMLDELQAALESASSLIPALESDMAQAIRMSPEEHRQQAIWEAEDVLRAYTQQLAKEDQQHEKTSRWLRLLRQSLAS